MIYGLVVLCFSVNVIVVGWICVELFLGCWLLLFGLVWSSWLFRMCSGDDLVLFVIDCDIGLLGCYCCS